jgi:hypothetical protein
MSRQAARELGDFLEWTISEAASELGVEKRLLKSWKSQFEIFESLGNTLSARDMAAARALKRLLIEEHYSQREAQRLIAEAGVDSVIAAYGSRGLAPAPASPAHVLQDAVRAAAAAGFFGEVYAEWPGAEGAETEAETTPIASYAHAKLARLGERK